jgi:hypothetical protein
MSNPRREPFALSAGSKGFRLANAGESGVAIGNDKPILAGHLTHEFPTNQTRQAPERYHDVTVWSRAVLQL